MPETSLADWYERTDRDLVRQMGDPAWLTRPMTSVCMVEKPSDLRSAHRDALVFVSGAAITGPEELSRLVRRAGEVACAALVIQTHRYIKELPAGICRLGQASRLVIFAAAFPASIEELMLAAFQVMGRTPSPGGARQDALAALTRAGSWSEQLSDQLEAAGFSRQARYQAAAVCAGGGGRELLPAWSALFGTCPAVMLDDILLGVFPDPEAGGASEAPCWEKLDELAGGAGYMLSDVYPGLAGLYRGCAEAVDLLRAQRSGAFPATLHQASNVTLWRTVERLQGSQVFCELIDRYYRPLAHSDRLYHTDYCRFMDIFLQCQGQIKAIAEQLGVHRNTVGHRIRSIEALIQASLQRPDVIAYMVLLFGAGPGHNEKHDRY